MKRRRIKVLSGEGVYHCISRAIPELPYWEREDKEMMRRMLWRVADFSGVELLAYCLMSNHFHILIRVPDAQGLRVSDSELLRRYKLLYPEPTKYERLQIDKVEQILQENGHQAESIRRRLLARMHDVSGFMKTFKQRYSLWYNRTHGRYGTLWTDRYTSVLVENTPIATSTVAAYIDLNPVRAGLVKDPKDYRWCSYAEAVAGTSRARAGIVVVTGHSGYHPAPTPEKPHNFSEADITKAMEHYRCLLFGKAAGPARGKPHAARVDEESTSRVLRQGGKLPTHHLLRCRVRYLTDGLIIGTRAYIKAQQRERLRRGEIKTPARERHVSPEVYPELQAAKSCYKARSG